MLSSSSCNVRSCNFTYLLLFLNVSSIFNAWPWLNFCWNDLYMISLYHSCILLIPFVSPLPCPQLYFCKVAKSVFQEISSPILQILSIKFELFNLVFEAPPLHTHLCVMLPFFTSIGDQNYRSGIEDISRPLKCFVLDHIADLSIS